MLYLLKSNPKLSFSLRWCSLASLSVCIPPLDHGDHGVSGVTGLETHRPSRSLCRPAGGHSSDLKLCFSTCSPFFLLLHSRDWETSGGPGTCPESTQSCGRRVTTQQICHWGTLLGLLRWASPPDSDAFSFKLWWWCWGMFYTMKEIQHDPFIKPNESFLEKNPNGKNSKSYLSWIKTIMQGHFKSVGLSNEDKVLFLNNLEAKKTWWLLVNNSEWKAG